MIARAAGVGDESISDEQLSEFKSEVVQALSPYASAVLIDPEYGSDAFGRRAASCGLLTTYEMDGYENPRAHRMPALRPELSVRRMRQMGSDGVKLLLSYTPHDDPQWNGYKHAMVERIGAECEAEGMPFFLEPVGYDVDGLDVKGAEYATRKPEIVLRTMEEFSRDQYRVDVLKVEFPVNQSFIDSRKEALDWYRRVDAVAAAPYIYLSAGVDARQFRDSLELAVEAETRFCGVLCGRATWQLGVPEYARGGLPALRAWLQSEGVANIRAVNDCLRRAASWKEWLRIEEASPRNE